MTQKVIEYEELAVHEENMCQNVASASVLNTEGEAEKYGRTKKMLESIEYMLNEKKVYLDPHINLYSLSLLLCTNTTYLSKIINRHFGCNLRTLLNRYRVDYAKELLKREKCVVKDLPPLCGFLSRSTFYAVFTKFEHITPVEFRQRYKNLELMKRIEYNLMQRNQIEI